MAWAQDIIACENKNKFMPSMSSSFVKTDKRWTLRKYGGVASGVLGNDVVRVGGSDERQFIMLNCLFGMATNLTSAFEETVFDGVLGLAFTADNGSGSKPFIVEAINNGYLNQAMFTVYLKPRQFKNGVRGGVITYGSTDNSNCGSKVDYYNLSSTLFYQFKINSISMGQTKHVGDYDVMQDFSTFIMGPQPIVDQFAAIAGAKYNKDFRLYEIECSANFPSLDIAIGSSKYSINHDKLIVKRRNPDSGGTSFIILRFDTSRNIHIHADNTCILALSFFGSSATFGPQWYFGAPFIQEYCVTFDIGGKRLGFADAHHRTVNTTSFPSRSTPVVLSNTTYRTTRHPQQDSTVSKRGSMTSVYVSFTLIIFLIVTGSSCM
ncbi:hypothetical protein Y032_1014g3395 [Ancylostoma ceylanicum]|uniref:Peptidase A1 domain-containing protein n=1 Tax=Ancylostoma ceylanicum TaxID=53326 RepID=A0A016W8L0_9BILA|nr:hypothetical protein Y032_1014g3395 [Ancylostoma ceylanicum]